MKYNTHIEQRVMPAVAAVYMGRKLASRTALECYALFVCAFSVTMLVSLPHVMANLFAAEASGLPAVGAFLFAAIANTSHIVQATLVVGAVMGTLAMLDIARAARMPGLRLA